MTDVQWKEAKKVILAGVGPVLEAWGFQQRGARFEWFRHVNDIYQLVSPEKMRGPLLRIRIFAVGNEVGTLGGELTHSTIEGGGYIAGDVRCWSISTSAEIEESLRSIEATLHSVALPWFDTFRDSSRLCAAEKDYRPAMKYDIDDMSWNDGTADIRIKEAENELWELDRVANFVSAELGPSLIGKGFKEAAHGYAYVRQRDSIFDVVKVKPVNYGVHFCCYAFNWIRELSPDGNDSYQPGSDILLVGGVLSEIKRERSLPSLYRLGNESIASNSLQVLWSRLNSEELPSLERVYDKEAFIRAVKPEHRSVLGNLPQE